MSKKFINLISLLSDAVDNVNNTDDTYHQSKIIQNSLNHLRSFKLYELEQISEKFLQDKSYKKYKKTFDNAYMIIFELELYDSDEFEYFKFFDRIKNCF